MSRILISLCLLVVVASLGSGLGCSTDGLAEVSNLQVAAGELKVWNDWSISPCLYTYERNATEVVKVTVSNLSSASIVFSMGDGKTLTVSANTSKEYKYRVKLVGQTERIRITKLVENQSGLSIQEALVLKIEPR